MNPNARPVSVAGTKSTYLTTSDREIVFERTYDAPRDRVFAAFCDPNKIPQWWGPPGTTTTVEAMDVRPGGTWRFVQVDERGRRYVFHGTYKEVAPPARVVSTLQFEGAPFVLQEVYEFVDQRETTLLRVTSTYPTGAALGGMHQAGMDRSNGWAEGSRHQWRIDRLAALVEVGPR